MALSQDAKERLVIALTSRKVGKEVSDAVDAGVAGADAADASASDAADSADAAAASASDAADSADAAAASAASITPAAHVADITSSNLVGVDGTGSNAAPLAGTETRLDALESKINAILAAMQAAGLMS